MKLLIIYILLFLFSTPVISQDPQFSWGGKIKRNTDLLENMEIVGVDEDGFFTTYQVNRQTTLEHCNPQYELFWTIALLPKTPDGGNATFHSVQMLKSRLYMLSSSSSRGRTRVYAQEISHKGNYEPEIALIAQGSNGESTHIATSPDDAVLLVTLAGGNGRTATITLLTDKLTPRWTQTIRLTGEVQETLVQPDGTSYILIKAPAATPATASFYLYQFAAKTGKYKELVLGHREYRPLKAKLAVAYDGSIVIAGYMSPSNSVASQNPEPVGTFMYRVNNKGLQHPFVSYTPFHEKFITEYKRYKPDHDSSQRLRHLHLDKVIPLPDGGMYIIGEVCITENRAGTFVHHNNDIVVVLMAKSGIMNFATSINKLQSGINKQNTIRSYFATAIQNTLKIIYLDFEYNYSFEDKIAMQNSRSSLKTPVMVTIFPNGTQKTKPLLNTQTGQNQGFYLRPSSAFKIADNEYIIIGMGPEFYRYGRMKL